MTRFLGPPAFRGRRPVRSQGSWGARRLAIVLVLAVGWSIAVAAAATAQETGSPATPSDLREGDCVVCHARAEIVETDRGMRQELLVPPETISASVHEGFSCTECHSPLVNTLHPEVDRASTSCEGCHEAEAKDHASGAHGSASDEGTPPTCVTCHGNHAVVKAEGTDFDEGLAERCAECHSEMSDRGFGSNPLGMETHLGRADVATCDDCHEPHKVLPQDDPRSSVHAANKLATCQQCHETAGPNFREIQIHVASGPLPDDFRLRVATLWMLAILIFTFGFFGWLTVLGIRHEWRHGRHRRHPHAPTSGGAP
jgi:hypothetical protein